MSKARCVFACTYSPLENQIKSGGISLTKANYNSLIDRYEVTIVATFKNKQNLFNKLFRLFWACWGFLGGNHYFFEKKWLKILQDQKPEVIFIDHSQLGKLAHISQMYLSSVSAPTPKNKRIIITNFHNIEADYLKNSSILPTPVRQILIWAAKKNESSAVKNSSYLISLTQEDSENLFHNYKRKADVIIPITLPSINLNCNADLEIETPHPNPYILFCGSYFPPNREAVEWFVREVLDSISFDLLVVGYQMETLQNILSHSKLKIIGTVDDLSPYYHYASAVVNPVQRGAGMNTKSVEAINYGKALIATSHALVGFPKERPPNIYTCLEAKDFILILQSLNYSAINAQELKDYFECYFNIDARKKKLDNIII